MKINLRDFDITEKFEVFVIKAEIIKKIPQNSSRDKLELGNFTTKKVFLLRREEWLDKSSFTNENLGGGDADNHKFIFTEKQSGTHDCVALVDTGSCILSSQGAELLIDADTFPLVFQMQYKVAPSKTPAREKIPL